MSTRPSVLCPVDFSAPSRAALCYAAAIAEHFGALLTVLAVDDPLLAEVAAATGRMPSLAEETTRELCRFAGGVLDRTGRAAKTEYRVVTGKPGPEILRIARETAADLIVMSSHGRSGVRRMFFGSTTERVLRQTTIPVLVTPDDRERVVSLTELSRELGRILAPVDLSPASAYQMSVASGLAAALSVPLIVTCVLEPVFVPASLRAVMPGAEAARRSEVEASLAALAAKHAGHVATETLVTTGEPSEEIVKLADVRGANLIVLGLHSSGLLGHRMGSVTYRVLCLANKLVLALPPKAQDLRNRALSESA